MKCIHLFIASSVVEFENERNELGNYIRSLNDIYLEHNIYFKLTMCENLTSAIELNGKQNFYNSKIRESDYFYVIFGKNAGEYTLEEFDVAMESFNATGKPKIYTYFMQLSDGKVSNDVLSFMKRLDDELGHYYSLFTHIDSIKLNILLEFSRDPQITSDISVENAHICIDGDSLLSLENIPVYSQNETLKLHREQMQELDNEFADAAAAYGAAPTNSELLQKMMDIGHKRGKLADIIQQTEKDIFELYSKVTHMKSEGRALNWWEQEAIRLLDIGNSEGALQILRDVQLQKEMEQAQDMADSNIERIISVINARKMAIQVLRTQGLTAEKVCEINEIYEEIVNTAEKYHVEMESFHDYASFAHDQHDFTKAENLTNKYLAWLRYTGEVDTAYINALLLQSIIFATTKQFDKAEKGFIELLNICNEKTSNEDLIDIYANVNNSLGMLMCTTKRLSEAEKYSLESIKTYRKLVEKHPTPENRCSLANSCDTLSQIYKGMDRYEDAKKFSAELYEITKSLAQENPEKYGPRYATSCAHYSMHLSKSEEFSKSEELLLYALDAFKKLSKENPGKYLPNVVWIMYLLGGKYYNYDNEKAYTYYSDAFEILMQLPQNERKHYTVNPTNLCSNLAVLLIWRGETDKAEKMLLQVLNDYENLYSAAPQIYLTQLGEAYNNLMLFYYNTQKYQESNNYAEKAKKLIEEAVLSQENPPAKHLDTLAIIYTNLGNIYKRCNYTEAAEAYTLKARYIYGKLYKNYGEEYSDKYFRIAENCAAIYEEKKDYDKAMLILTEAYEHFRQLGRPCHEISNISAKLMVYYINSGKLNEAEQMQREVLKLTKQGYSSDKHTYAISYAQACNNVAAVLSRKEDALKRLDEMSELYSTALQIYCDICEEDSVKNLQYLINIYKNLLNCKQNQKDNDGALELLRNMENNLFKWCERDASVHEPVLAIIYYDHANMVSNTLNDKVQGRELLCKALQLAKKYPQLQQLSQQIEQILEKYF